MLTFTDRPRGWDRADGAGVVLGFWKRSLSLGRGVGGV